MSGDVVGINERGHRGIGRTGMDRKRILMVRPTALGDVCRTVPVLVTLREAFPEAVIDWVVRDVFVESVAGHPALDEVIPFARNSASDVWQMMRMIRQRRYDVVIDLQGLARSGLITWWSGAADRVGFANAREGAALAYRRGRRFAIDPTMHTVDRMLGLIGAAWPDIALSHDMRLYVSDADRAWAKDTVANGKDDAGEYVGGYACLAPTAQWLCKCWPIENYVAIGKRLLEASNGIEKIVVIAAPSERAQVQPLLDALNGFAICPSTTVGQMMGLIAGSRVLVCNDSAALHMGVGLDRPLVAIFGPTDPALVGPYRRELDVVQPAKISAAEMTNYRRRRDDQGLIGQVEVEPVWAKVCRILG